MRSSDTTRKQTQTSGISRVDKLPKVLSYPMLLPFDTTMLSIKNIFCYIVRYYGNDGLSVLIYRQPELDQVVAIFGDWNGNNIDLVGNSNPNRLTTLALQFAQSNDGLPTFLKTMQLTRIEQAQFFFGIDEMDLVLVDMQVAFNKFASPGMVRDIFGNIYKTQEVLKMEFIDDRAIEFIQKGTGSYEGDLIFKPSKFRMYHDAAENTFQPLYVEMRR